MQLSGYHTLPSMPVELEHKLSDVFTHSETDPVFLFCVVRPCYQGQTAGSSMPQLLCHNMNSNSLIRMYYRFRFIGYMTFSLFRLLAAISHLPLSVEPVTYLFRTLGNSLSV